MITKQDISISKFQIYAFHDWRNSYTNTANKKSAFEGDFNILPLKPGMITTQVFLLFFASLIYFITLCNFVGIISEGEI